MKKLIQEFITDNQNALTHCRSAFDTIRNSSPIEACELLHIGTDRASGLLSLSRSAYSKGVIDRTILMEAVALANAWLAFDDEVLDLVAEIVPVPEAPLIGIVLH